MEYTLAGSVKPLTALAAQAVTGTVTGEIIDSYDFNSMTFIVSTGAITSDVTLTLEHSDDSGFSSSEVVPSDLVFGDLPSLTSAANTDGQVWLGYFGKKRYVRLSVASGSADLSAVALLGHPEQAPTLGPNSSGQYPNYG